MNKFVPFWQISAMIIFLDQLSKYLVRNVIHFGTENLIRITKSFFWLTRVQNNGAAFSLSLGNVLLNKIFFIIFSLFAIVIIIIVSRKSKSKIEQIAYAFILGGALGNLIDRVFIGSVTDFIWWIFPDFIMQRWPVFNIADSSIFIALTILVVYYLFFNKKELEGK